jgi:hypothetical protein
VRVLLATVLAALALASPAAADWRSADFTATWPLARGRTFVYHFTVPPSYAAIQITVDGTTLYGGGRWAALACPTFTIRSSLAAYTVRYSRDSTYVTVYFRQGSLAYLCLSGYAGGDSFRHQHRVLPAVGSILLFGNRRRVRTLNGGAGHLAH